MGLPTFTKTWYFNANNKLNSTGGLAAGNALGDNQQLMFFIKDQLCNWGNWTVIGSSNSVASSMDGTDRWLGPANIIWAQTGVAQSWIVLERSDNGFQVCLDCNTGGTATNAYANISGSFVGYGTAAGGTDGSVTTRPTATDEVVIINNLAWHNMTAANPFTVAVHTMTSSDGVAQRIIVYQSAVPVLYIAFETVANPVTGWSNPFVWCWLVNTTTYATLNDAAVFRGCHNSSWFTAYLSTEGYVDGALGQRITVANDLSSDYAIAPVGILSDTPGLRGRHGNLYDLWFGSTTPTDGDKYPDTGTKLAVTFGDLVFPWNGSSTVLT